ncbi:MAG: ATP phosphoribosyltransferase regulatory subunit [Burkholderiales bacterium]|nr:ATP phosphoribosyltransferase regulatory subunit [Burkholderiales bacterium]
MSVWLLPENIADMLPREARLIERLRSKFFSLVQSHGFEVVRPPMIEYVDSLLTGSGSDLDLRTFKIIDQVSGRTLGIRADMTPQVARIDAHILNRSGISRLCYAGSVLHARPLHPIASRQPYVCGIELFGSSSHQSDLEVIRIGLEVLNSFGLDDQYLDIGHVGVVRSVLDTDPRAHECLPEILTALKLKDPTELDLAVDKLKPETVKALIKLMRLFGGEEVLDKIEEELSAFPGVRKAVEEVRWIAERCQAKHISFDFSAVHGYQYLTGITYSVTIPGCYQSVLRGGRYDNVGSKFGRDRPAVGFTLYLREMIGVIPTKRPYAIVAPGDIDDPALTEKINSLRGEGKIVVQLLPGDNFESLEDAFRLDEELVLEDGKWQIVRRYFKKE